MKKQNPNILNFCKRAGITINQFYGKEKVGSYLYLSRLTSIPEGFNPTVGGYLYLRRLTSIPEGFNPTVGGSLDLSSLTSIPEGFNPTVGGYLDLSSLTSIPEGFNPTVGGSLDLSRLTSIPEGFNPTVGGSLDLSRLTSIPEGFNPTVGGYLDLSRLTSIPEGFNPTVGGYLDLRRLTSIPEGFNPTVGGSLDLRRLTSIPEGFNPTVGGSLDLSSGLKAIYKKLPSGYLLSWQDGKYLLADGIFTEVISHKGNVYHVRKIGEKEIFYLIADGNGKWSHGETLKEAKSDLMFKIGDRTKDDYKHLKVTDTLSFEDAIMCYRVITGACSFGTKDFVTNRLKNKQKKFTINEIIKVTKGEWGNRTFSDFFIKL
jgi:hypothetical protein